MEAADERLPALVGGLCPLEPADVVWACRLISRLSDRQLADAFRAAHYAPEVSARYIAKIRAKLQQGLAVEADGGRTP